MFNQDSAVKELISVFSVTNDQTVVDMSATMSEPWLKKVWDFLHRFLPDDLSSFIELPIIPLPNNQLCRLSEKLPVMVEQGDGYTLPSRLQDILKHLKVTIIPSIPDYVQRHSYIERCVLQPRQFTRVVKQTNEFLQSQGLSLSNQVATLSAELKRKFRLIVTELGKEDVSSILNILKSLPLCETIANSGNKESHFVSAQEVTYAGPTDAFPVPFRERLIQVQSPQERTFATLLGIPMKSTAQVLIDLMPHLTSKHEVESVAEMALHGISDYQKQHTDFVHSLSRLKFVSTKEKGFAIPEDLVYSSNSDLRVLLAEIDVLPVGRFSDRKYLPALEQLGLRTEPTADEVYNIAMKIDRLTKEREPKSLEFAHLLLKFFEQNPTILSSYVSCIGSILKEAIHHKSWVPVMQNRHETYPSSLPWVGLRQLTVSPSEGVQEKYASVCGSTCVVMPNSNVLQSQTPNICSVVQHLKNCTKNYSNRAEDIEYLATILAIYSFLHQEMGQSFHKIKEAIKSEGLVDWIWKGDGFTSVERIVAQRPTILVQPYVYHLPVECTKVKDLFLQCGMKEKCKYMDVLRMMKEYHDDKPDVSEEEKQRDLEMAVSILNQFSKEFSPNEYPDVLVPIHTKDERLQLLPISECVYCDIEWHKRGIDLDDLDDINDEDEAAYVNMVHREISSLTAERLGVQKKTKQQVRVGRLQHGISFGQKEKLTNRLRRLLSGYPCGIEILKELLQNADDAGAGMIHFILDPRTHKADKVFDDKWKELNGPALLVYNDKPFTQRDLEGIQNLGEGSKGNDPNKTGKYGVGFNCVYHVTDTPTFLTTVEGRGKYLCVLDPHCRYVSGASPEYPGQMFEVDNSLVDDFPDVFSCYMSGEPSLSPDQGTMFRLPLRNRRMAQSSEITDKDFDSTIMAKLFEEFKPQLSEMLLFINNVHTVTLSKVDEVTGEIKAIYDVHTEQNEANARQRHDFNNHVKQMMRQVKDGEVKLWDVGMKETMYEMEITKSDQWAPTEQWLVVQRFGLDSPDDMSSRVKKESEKHDLGLCPRGGVAYKMSATGSATPQSKIFCFLPLPVKTDLPVHVNGNFALTYEIRHDLVCDERSALSDWNEMMFCAVIAPAYVTLVDHHRLTVPREGEQMLEAYFRFFPSVPQGKNEQTLQKQFPLRAGVYKLIHEKSLKFLPMVNNEDKDHVVITWHPAVDENEHQTYFDTLKEHFPKPEGTTYRSSLSTGLWSSSPSKPKHEELAKILMRCGMVLVHAPTCILANFQSCGVPAKAISPANAASFLTNPQCKIETLPRPIQDTPLKTDTDLVLLCQYLRSTDNHDNCLSLDDLPIVLTRDKMLRKLHRSEVFHTSYYEAVATVKDHILHENLLTELPVDYFCTMTVQDFAQMLERMLPQKFKGKDAKVLMATRPANLPENWIYNVWVFIDDCIKKTQAAKAENNPNQSLPVSRTTQDFETIEEVAQSIKEWALVPCIHREEQYLVAIGKANAVLDLKEGDYTSQKLRDALSKLPIMRPDYDVLHSSPSLQKLVAIISSPESVLWALANVQKDIAESSVEFEENEGKLIIEHFATTIEQLRSVPRGIDTLRCLPIFKTVKGNRVRLIEASYIVPYGIPSLEIDAFNDQNTSMYVFLEEDEMLAELYRFLGCQYLEIEEFYSQFVFEQFDQMTNDGRIAHLKFLRDEITKKKEHKDYPRLKNVSVLMNRLREVPFIEVSSTEDPDTKELRKASSFYDPHTNVFRALVPEKFLPPEPFNEEEWRVFLVELGMITKVTEKHMVEFCTILAKLGRSNSPLPQKVHDGIRERVRVLVRYLFSEPYIPDTMLTAIKDIKFLPPYHVCKDKSDVCQQAGMSHGSPQLRCFSGSAFETEEDYAWSRVPLLPQAFHPDCHLPTWIEEGSDMKFWNGRKYQMEHILHTLGVVYFVPVDMIAEHSDNMCRSVEKKLTEMKMDTKVNHVQVQAKIYDTLLTVLTNIFDLLKGQKQAIGHSFGNLRIIPAKQGDRIYFIKGSQIVTQIDKRRAIIPYLFSMPMDFGRYEDLFLKIGSVQEATADTLARVLKQIYHETKDEVLHANEKVAVMCCYKELCYFLSRSMEQLSLQENELYLPGDDEKLHQAHLLVYNDVQSIMSRLSGFCEVFLIEIDGVNLSMILPNLPVHLRPRPLSSLVVEAMCEGVEESNSLCEAAIRLGARLSSRQFREGLCRLIAQERSATIRKVGLYNIQESKLATEKVENIKVTNVHALRTHLMYQNDVVPDSEEPVEVFIKMCGEELEVIVDHESEIPDDLIAMKLGPCVQEMFGITMQAPLLLWLFTLPLNRISVTLDMCNIKRLSSIAFLNSYLPRCGDFVHPRFHGLLVQRIEELCNDQYVAVLMNEPLDEEEEIEPTYIYGKIVKQENPEEIMLKRTFLVDIGRRDNISFNILELHSFHRKSSEASTGGGDNTAVPEIASKSLEEIQKELSSQLEAAYDLPGKTAHQLGRRLLQVWSPNNYPEYSDKAQNIYKYLKSKIERLEKLRVTGYNCPEGGDQGCSGQSYHSSPGYFEYLESRCRKHQQQQATFRKNRSEQRTVNGFFIPKTSGGKNPQPAEGRRWLKQAAYDLEAARNDDGRSNEWVCFKCHQVN